MKKLVLLLLIFVLVICALCFVACGNNGGSMTPPTQEQGGGSQNEDDEVPTEYISTEGLEYVLSDDGTYYICIGIGTASGTNIGIADTYKNLPVKEIESDAFRDCSSLENISIPSSVTNIGADAFYGCNNLQYNEYDNGLYLGNSENKYLVLVKAKDISILSCEMNSNTKIIYASAFHSCYMLQSVLITNDIISIGDNAFKDCSNLLSITVGSGVTKIGDDAFENCSNLTKVNYLGTIDQWVMIEFWDIYANPTYLAGSLYINNELVTDVILTTETKISNFVFYNCYNLQSVTITNGVTSIGDSTFAGCYNLERVIIPNSVNSIGDEAFYRCGNLESINYSGTQAQWNAIAKVSDWNESTGNYIIHCTDGDIEKS